MSCEIQCILFCEFHPVAGTKIAYQVPEDFITKEQFDCVAVYIITKPELQSKLITVNALKHKLVGCPISIENAKYSRNALLFNVCFIFGENADTVCYEGVVKKLAGYLTTLETEDGFLSNEETKKTLPEILTKILTDLNEKGQCTIPIDEANTIHLKPTILSKEPFAILDHHVPIFIWDREVVVSSQWDITTQQILPYIDGFNHMQRLASEADVDISLVRKCIQDMVYFGVIKLISIFQYSNVYIPTPEINQLMDDRKLQEECIHYVVKKGRSLPSFHDVFMLYCSLSPGATVRDVCSRHNPTALKVDERRLIQFGMVKGFIRRLHKYPVMLAKPKEGEFLRLQARRRSEPVSKLKSIEKYLNGNHNYDEICCKTGFAHQELEDMVENNPHVVVIWK